MTLAQRRTQVETQRGGLTPLVAQKRDHLVTKQVPMVPMVPHAPVKSLPPGPWSKHATASQSGSAQPKSAPSAVRPMTGPPDPAQVVGDSLVYPGEITLDVDTQIPAGTSASSLQAFGVLIYDTTGTLVYSQTIPENVDPSTYTGESGGYCYGWWPPSKYPADWCFWAMGNPPGAR